MRCSWAAGIGKQARSLRIRANRKVCGIEPFPQIAEPSGLVQTPLLAKSSRLARAKATYVMRHAAACTDRAPSLTLWFHLGLVQLAMWQARYVRDALQRQYPDIKFEGQIDDGAVVQSTTALFVLICAVIGMTTLGDKDQIKPLSDFASKVCHLRCASSTRAAATMSDADSVAGFVGAGCVYEGARPSAGGVQVHRHCRALHEGPAHHPPDGHR